MPFILTSNSYVRYSEFRAEFRGGQPEQRDFLRVRLVNHIFSRFTL